MKTISRVTAIIVLILSLTLLSIRAAAQNNEPKVEQKGNLFIAKKSTRGAGQVVKTHYIYEDSKGQRDTIFLSSTGKAFVWRVSKNGNTYKKYLPEVTHKINPQAYDNEKTKNR